VAEVTLRSVRKVYPNGHVAIDDASFGIRDGELLVLVGPSGCGKSTLLRLIAGLEESSAGSILIGERDVTQLEPRDRDIAMVFQSYALYPHMTVARNLGLRAGAARARACEIEQRVKQAAETLELTQFLIDCRDSSPAVSVSASRSAARSCAIRRCSCSTNRCPTSMRSCVRRLAQRSLACIARSARR
jgi:ABC-type sugar transport system ATPase subunit